MVIEEKLSPTALEGRLHRRIRTLVSRELEFRRGRVVQSPMQEPKEDFADQVGAALDSGRITDQQEMRIETTDFIMRAQRREDGTPVWIAVVASNTVHSSDIEHVRASADALHAVFGLDVVAVTAGYGIAPLDVERAKAAGVTHLRASLP